MSRARVVIATVTFMALTSAMPAGAVPAAPSLPMSGMTSAVPAPYFLDDTKAGAGLLLHVHGCHFDLGPNMDPDRVNGPHYHDNQCRVVRTGPPPRSYQRRDYDDEPRGHRPRYQDTYPEGVPPPRGYRDRGPYGYAPPPPPPEPVCYERCRWRGPFKVCKTVCE